jgi:HSP20 family protein
MARQDFNPFDIFRQMEMEMQRFNEEALRTVAFHPRVDMYETADALVIKFELAGVKPEKLEVMLSADDRTLTISGVRGEAQEERNKRIRCYQLEIYFGAFERTVTLPTGIPFDRERIVANYRDGFLVISLPKQKTPVPQKRTIEISSE